MKILLDTHMLLWLLTGDKMLSRKARKLIEDEANEIYFSSVSIAEIANKHNFKPEQMPIEAAEVREEALAANLNELVFDGNHAARLSDLPQHHRDPFDRMLVAQALGSQMSLLSHDDFVLMYDGTLKY